MICEQIIPADEDPGAHDAAVVNYIDKQLAPDGRIEASLPHYRQGLAAVEQTSTHVFKKPFEELSWEQQTQLLKMLEGNKADQAYWQHQEASQFFEMVRRHTIEGFFGHPRYGGNRGLPGYRLLGIEYPELRGQNRYVDARFRNAGKGGAP